MLKWLKRFWKKETALNYASVSIPTRGDDWGVIVEFAKVINGYRIKGGFKGAADLASRDEWSDLSVSDIHVALFFEYRRFNHFGYTPENQELEKIYRMLDEMHRKLASQVEG